VATAVRLPAAALSWFPRREPETHCVPQPVPPDLVFFVFFINPGNFNRQNQGCWRKASGPENKLLRDPATQAESLQAAFQSELICKQMQGLLLRPVDCSESLSLRQFGIGRYSVIMQETRYNPSGKWSEVGPHDSSLLRITTRFSSWRVLLFVMISGNVTSHIVLSSPVRVTQSVMFFPNSEVNNTL
jgi:hypothetical protein